MGPQKATTIGKFKNPFLKIHEQQEKYPAQRWGKKTTAKLGTALKTLHTRKKHEYGKYLHVGKSMILYNDLKQV